MGLAAVVRSGVAIAHKVTTDLQATVMHQAWIGDDVNEFGDKDGYGSDSHAAAVARTAIVEFVQKPVKTATGQMLTSRATVMFLTPITPNGATGRQEPIDPRDIITLPDGSTGPILDISGMVDSGTDKPYFSVVSIG